MTRARIENIQFGDNGESVVGQTFVDSETPYAVLACASLGGKFIIRHLEDFNGSVIITREGGFPSEGCVVTKAGEMDIINDGSHKELRIFHFPKEKIDL